MIAALIAQMEADRAIILDESHNGWLRSLLTDDVVDNLANAVEAEDFEETLALLDAALQSARYDSDARLLPVPPRHEYMQSMTSFRPVPPVAGWRMTLPGGAVLGGSDAAAQLRGFGADRNWHPFFGNQPDWTDQGYYGKAYIGKDARRLELILDAPLLIAVQIGVSGGNPPNNHILSKQRFVVSAPLEKGELGPPFALRTVEKGKKFEFGFYVDEYKAWKFEGNSIYFNKLFELVDQPNGSLLREFGLILNGHQTAGEGNNIFGLPIRAKQRGYRSGPGAPVSEHIIFLKISQLGQNDYYLAIAKFICHLVWIASDNPTVNGQLTLGAGGYGYPSRGGYVTPIPEPYFIVPVGQEAWVQP